MKWAYLFEGPFTDDEPEQPEVNPAPGGDPAAAPGGAGMPQAGGDINGVPVPLDDTDTDMDGEPLPDNGVDPEEVLSGLETHPFMDYEHPDQYDPVTMASMDRAALTDLQKDATKEILRLRAGNSAGQYANEELRYYTLAKEFIERLKQRLALLTDDQEEKDDANDTEFNPAKKRDEPTNVDAPVKKKPVGENRAVIVSRTRL